MALIDYLGSRAKLMGRMMDFVGVDYSQTGGPQATMDLREAAFRCTACNNVEACSSWFDASPSRDEAAPSFCPNIATFEKYKRF